MMGPALFLAGVLFAQPAAASQSLASPSTASQSPAFVPGRALEWTGRSTDLWRFFPAKAARYGVDSGQITLICAVAERRKIGRCDVLGETPDNFQFSNAAQMFVRQMTLVSRHTPRTGEPVLIEMRITYPEKDSALRVFRAVPATATR